MGRDAASSPGRMRRSAGGGTPHRPGRVPKKQGLGFSSVSGRKDPNPPWGRWRRALKKNKISTREDTRAKKGEKNNKIRKASGSFA